MPLAEVAAIGRAAIRTMVDALDPFVKALRRASAKASREALLTAVDEAQKGADATAQIKPRLGRSSYLGSRVLGHPDPGAAAVAIWLRAVCEALFARGSDDSAGTAGRESLTLTRLIE
jgi:dihydroxyacetone kinase